MTRIGTVIVCAAALALALTWAPALPAAAASGEAPAGDWVCPHHAGLDRGFDEPGRCPVCGMKLVPRSELVHAAILVFDGVQIIDYAAPYEVFGQARFYTYLVSPDGGPITTSMDMHVTPHFGIDDAPRPDVLLVPGGDVGAMRESEEVLAWVRESAAGADHVLSVCNGAFILAQAGLLDGLTATTFHRLLEELALRFPRTEVVRGVRFVDNGKIVTSAGLSAGIDAAIHLVGEVKGAEAAPKLAAHLEYAWDPAAVGEPEPVGRKLAGPELHAYDGLYELEGGGRVAVRGSAEDRIPYAWIEGDRHPLLPLGGDRFLNTAGDVVRFVRGDDGEVVGYRVQEDDEPGSLHRRLGESPAEGEEPAGGR